MTSSLLSGALALLLALPAWAEITVTDAYMRASFPGGPTGAAFMHIENSGTEADRLIEARSDIAARVELHTHMDAGDGVMKMMQLEQGIEIPAGDMHVLARGGDHVMFMGLTEPLEQGAIVPVTLVFERAGEMQIEVIVDQERAVEHGTH